MATTKKPATPVAKKKPTTVATESKVKTATKAVKETVKKVVAKAAAVQPKVEEPKTVVKRKSAVKKSVPAKPWDNVEGEKLKAQGDTPTVTFPLIPVKLDSVGEEVFSHTFDHELELNDGNIVLKTGYISTNRSIDLLALSTDPRLVVEGLISQSDSIVDDIKLASLHIRVNGEDKFVSCDKIAQAPWAVDGLSNSRSRTTELTVVVRVDGSAYAIAVHGAIALDTGTCYVSAHSNANVEVVGYYLDLKRYNRNR